MAKRYRTIVAKPGQLVCRYGRVDGEPDLGYAWGGQGADKSDSRIIMSALEGAEVHQGRNLREELDRRGYDIETLKFSIQKKTA